MIASASANEMVYAGKNYTFGTLPPSLLYVQAAFRCLSRFNASRVAVLRDINDPMCLNDTVSAVSEQSSVELYGYYTLDQTAPDYEDQILAILSDLKANGVESVIGCSYRDLCIYVSVLLLVTTAFIDFALCRFLLLQRA